MKRLHAGNDLALHLVDRLWYRLTHLIGVRLMERFCSRLGARLGERLWSRLGSLWGGLRSRLEHQ